MGMRLTPPLPFPVADFVGDPFWVVSSTPESASASAKELEKIGIRKTCTYMGFFEVDQCFPMIYSAEI